MPSAALFNGKKIEYQFANAEVYYLEMHHQPELILPPLDWSFKRIGPPISTSVYLYYYYTTGISYNWLDRLLMPTKELKQLINDPSTASYALAINGEEAGFSEFIFNGVFTEIQYFGLFPGFVGQGWGKMFLREVINKAWSFAPKWIQLNTCSLDHPSALPVYTSAGFKIVKTELEQRKILVNL
jgi:GNAT superfamily N-acetyltransferase